MSVRISMLRDAVAGLVSAVEESGAPITGDLALAVNFAAAAFVATRFVAPDTFPAPATTRCGIACTLHAFHDGRLIGSFVDTNGLQLLDWDENGSIGGVEDDLDLNLPEDAPAYRPPLRAVPQSNASFAAAGVVNLPILGRIS